MSRPLRRHAVVIGASMAGLATARVLSDHFDSVTVARSRPAARPGPGPPGRAPGTPRPRAARIRRSRGHRRDVPRHHGGAGRRRRRADQLQRRPVVPGRRLPGSQSRRAPGGRRQPSRSSRPGSGAASRRCRTCRSRPARPSSICSTTAVGWSASRSSTARSPGRSAPSWWSTAPAARHTARCGWRRWATPRPTPSRCAATCGTAPRSSPATPTTSTPRSPSSSSAPPRPARRVPACRSKVTAGSSRSPPATAPRLPFDEASFRAARRQPAVSRDQRRARQEGDVGSCRHPPPALQQAAPVRAAEAGSGGLPRPRRLHLQLQPGLRAGDEQRRAAGRSSSAGAWRSTRTTSPWSPAFYKQAAKVIANPWQIAVGADFAYPECTGPKPAGTDLINRYMRSGADRGAGVARGQHRDDHGAEPDGSAVVAAAARR